MRQATFCCRTLAAARCAQPQARVTPPPPTRAAELEALQECTIGLGSGDQREMLSRMVSKIAALEAAVAAAEAKRREIHNQLVELKGNVRGWGACACA